MREMSRKKACEENWDLTQILPLPFLLVQKWMGTRVCWCSGLYKLREFGVKKSRKKERKKERERGGLESGFGTLLFLSMNVKRFASVVFGSHLNAAPWNERTRTQRERESLCILWMEYEYVYALSTSFTNLNGLHYFNVSLVKNVRREDREEE